jgi:hypothetical protein
VVVRPGEVEQVFDLFSLASLFLGQEIVAFRLREDPQVEETIDRGGAAHLEVMGQQHDLVESHPSCSRLGPHLCGNGLALVEDLEALPRRRASAEIRQVRPDPLLRHQEAGREAVGAHLRQIVPP